MGKDEDGMNIELYRERRRSLEEQAPRYREFCTTCLQPRFGCFCADLKPFDPGLRFVILTHPIEMKRRIATGRMTHLCLEGSRFIVGHDYSHHPEVDALIADPRNHCVILYPGRSSVNLSQRTPAERHAVFPAGKTPVLFVIDGTWATARQTARQSRNLMSLPRICFTPPGPSNFRVRKQPAPECYSTIEAVHHTIELLGGVRGFDVDSRRHDALLEVFDGMVERQLTFLGRSPPRLRIHAERKRKPTGR